jgi:ABC-type multidrug transport system fused ATPase/permease subunit
VRVRYRAQQRCAIDGVGLDLSPGRRVAVVGPSGAGKSTLAATLLRFLPYEDGSITLDGRQLASLRGDDVRLAIGLAAQDAHIFDTTLEENLRLARRDASLEELEHALTAAHLDGLPARLPDGWGTELGPFGSRLSGGERQRLSVARALLGRFPVLVLDEPAEYLETEIGDALVAELLSSSEPTALLLITHRLAPLHRADEILVMDEGRVIERGSHQDLVAVGGLYKALWNAEQSEAPRDPFSGRSRPIARNGRRGVASAPFPCRGPESGEAADEFAS